MDERILAKRYINALIGQTPADDILMQLQDTLTCLNVLTSNETVTPFLLSPIQSKDDKHSVITPIIGRITEYPSVIQFFKVLIDKQRLPLMPYLKEDIKHQMSRLEKKLTVTIYMAQQPTHQIRQNIIQTLSQHISEELDITFKEDPSVIGGFRAVAGATIYDGSIKSILSNLKQTMLTTH